MKFNNAAVLIKIAIIFIFIGVGLFFIKPKNYQPFTPYGTTGVLRGATTVFFAFLGFDVVSSSAAEVKNPKKKYANWNHWYLNCGSPSLYGSISCFNWNGKLQAARCSKSVAYALKLVNQGWVADLLSIGAIVGMSTMMLTMIYSSSRLIYSIGRDGLLPNFLGKIDKHGLQKMLFGL